MSISFLATLTTKFLSHTQTFSSPIHIRTEMPPPGLCTNFSIVSFTIKASLKIIRISIFPSIHFHNLTTLNTKAKKRKKKCCKECPVPGHYGLDFLTSHVLLLVSCDLHTCTLKLSKSTDPKLETKN